MKNKSLLLPPIGPCYQNQTPLDNEEDTGPVPSLTRDKMKGFLQATKSLNRATLSYSLLPALCSVKNLPLKAILLKGLCSALLAGGENTTALHQNLKTATAKPTAEQNPAPAESNTFLTNTKLNEPVSSLTGTKTNTKLDEPVSSLTDKKTNTKLDEPVSSLTNKETNTKLDEPVSPLTGKKTNTQPLLNPSTKTSSTTNKELIHLQRKNTPHLPKFGFFKKNTPYLQFSDGKFHVIYSKDFQNLSPFFYKLNHSTHKKLSKFFRLKTNFRNNFTVFFSPRQQIPLHYASGQRFLLGLHPFSGIFALDQAALSQPTQSLILHEMSHLYQLSQNTKWDRRLWPLIGLFATRNFLLSSFALEGSAVFNESLLGTGGRLFSGWFKAFALSQIQEGLNLTSLLKPLPESFFSQMQYVHGAYFFAFLHNQYGKKAQSRFFFESGRFFPAGQMGLSASLQRAFGKDLKTLFKEYKQYYTPLAKGHKFLPQKALLTSQVFTPLNSDQHRIYFLTFDQKSPPRLIVFNKKTSQITHRAINIPLGKLFYKKGEWLSAGCARTSSSSVECSLFQEGFKSKEAFRSRLVMDLRGPNSLSFDSRQNLLQSSLLINDEFYEETHSSAVFGPRGEVYYFQQEGSKRTLYRNKSPLFQFSSHYGYPVEADEEGLWFIGPTQHGSGLFVYKEGQGVFKLGESDAIIYARRIDENRFLICEIRPTAYEYKILNIKENQPIALPYLVPSTQETLWATTKKNLNTDDYNKAYGSLTQIQKNTTNPPDITLTQIQKSESLPDITLAQIQKSETPPNATLAQIQKSTTNLPDATLTQIQKNTTNPPDITLTPNKKAPARAIRKLSTLNSHSSTDTPLKEGPKLLKDFTKSSPPLSKPYNSLQALNLVNLSLLAYPEISLTPVFSVKGFYFAPLIQWIDPLNFNEFKMRGVFRTHYKAFKWTYIYKKYRPSIQFSLKYNEIPETPKRGTLLKRLEDLNLWDQNNTDGFYSSRLKKKALYYRDVSVEVFFKYPLVIKPFWNLSIGAGLTKGLVQIESQRPKWFAQPKNLKNYMKHKGELDYSYKRKYKHAWDFHKKRQVTLFYEMLHSFNPPPQHRLKTGFYIDMIDEWGKEWFVSWGVRAVNGILDPATPILLKNKAESLFYKDFPKTFALQAKSIYQIDFHVLKVLNWTWRPLTLPFSLQRKALFAGVSFSSTDIFSHKPNNKTRFLSPEEKINYFKNNLHYYGMPFIGAEWEWNLLDKENLIFKTGFSYNYVIQLHPTKLFDGLSQKGLSGFWTDLKSPEKSWIQNPGGSYWSFWIKGHF